MVDHAAQPKRQASVDDILAGCAEMHAGLVRRADRCLQLPHQFRHDHAVLGHPSP
jgi:hypothetical protein